MLNEQIARALTLPELVQRLTDETDDPVIRVLLAKLEGIDLEGIEEDAAEALDEVEQKLRALRHEIDEVLMGGQDEYETVEDVMEQLRCVAAEW